MKELLPCGISRAVTQMRTGSELDRETSSLIPPPDIVTVSHAADEDLESRTPLNS